jgi:hypothetical protein
MGEVLLRWGRHASFALRVDREFFEQHKREHPDEQGIPYLLCDDEFWPTKWPAEIGPIEFFELRPLRAAVGD